MAFPVTIHERIPPGTDPNNANGVYEAVHKQILFKILKELKQAVQNYGVSFPTGSESKDSACNAGNLGSVPGLGRSLGE